MPGPARTLSPPAPATAWPPCARAASDSGALHGDTAAEHAGGARLTARPLWKPPADIPLDADHEAHGGGDPRMLDALFGPVDAGRPADPGATERDGALAPAVGLAANRCFGTGKPVAVRDPIPGLWER